MALKVIVASRTEQENQILVKRLEVLSMDFANLSFLSVHPLGLPSAIDDATSVVMMNFAEWSSKEHVHLDELIQTRYTGPLLISAKGMASDVLSAAPTLQRVVFLEKPFEGRDLLGIVSKMLHERLVAQRFHRRYITEQTADVEVYSIDKRVSSHVRNLSKGGAYLELMSPTPIEVGEMVQVRMELNEVNRTYTMSAKVVWTNQPRRGPLTVSAEPEAKAIGVEFIGRGDMSKRLIGY